MTSPDPSSIRCPVHPEHAPSKPCVNCGTFICEACLSLTGKRAVCATCLEDGRVNPYAVGWLYREDLGVLRAWWMTVQEMLSRPAAFFDALDAESPVGDSLRFAGVSVGMMMALFCGISVLFCGGGGLAVALSGDPQTGGLIAGAGIFYGFAASLSPLCILSFLVFFQHPVMLLLGGARRGFGATAQVACYSLGFYPAAAIPCFSIFFILGILAYQVIGYSRIHQEPVWKASVAVLFPLSIGGFLYLFLILWSTGVVPGFGPPL